ncbi:protein of unknown function [Ruminococcaceae bacterium BL-6]|nr:protein of unknown function [Ruminococcaceae bacterium BL-6]
MRRGRNNSKSKSPILLKNLNFVNLGYQYNDYGPEGPLN